ncbi:RNA polymerase-associated protein RapA [Dokdonella sp.]|uniref:RNA polymerase-associated protein RapA n=1 Tax=Dokdonella sp. TaxID=2291710 RepID=UPI001AFEE1F5|nr:RNA polymerase-associated protein RapA [Dokdonella sp.]MBO9663634.1 RNA polymerase-associated protein RapA [Dokdonella sp.]
MAFVPGQRWISNAEPELGLGTVVRLDGRNVQVLFATAGVLRHYAMHAAPLARAEFRVGQKISGQKRSFVVERVSETGGLLSYHGGAGVLSESELDDAQPISRADERLLSTRIDAPDRFDFRRQALTRRAEAMRSPAFGLAGARIDLIPHQLRVAEIVAQRQPPRALLADEVGLGKTIEAGMILARLLATGRVARVLVLAPGSLTSQWLIELLRRFNLSFALFDEERCEAIEVADAGRNPFEDEQCVIADIGWLAAAPRRAAQLGDAEWDLVVVDEAHHLEWSPLATSASYALVERLAVASPGLILLTATPQQLGRSGHFARLRLLDPARYVDLDAFAAEADGYVQLSAVAAQLLDAQALSPNERAELQARFADDAELLALLERYDEDRAANAPALLDALIDRHGTGRVMFRNRRAQIGGFPRRVAEIDVLDGGELDDAQRQQLLAEFHADAQTHAPAGELDYADDPRLPWLVALIEKLAGQKLLLICRSQAKVLALEDALRTKSGAKVARFHEGMTILQRDRNAAFFAEADGARVLLCSEIGSEGRNFQFAHHLVLWDLPLDPDLLEQRIGRLDRIGQRHDIQIHAAAFSGSAQHALLRWYHEGLDALRSSPSDGREILRRYGPRLLQEAERHALGGEEADVEIDSLIAETAATHRELSELVNAGRDRLLELASERQAREQHLAEALRAQDADVGADEFVLALFEQFGVDSEETGPRTCVLDPEYLSTDGFPGLKDGPQQVTFDRAVALAREELPLLRLDHPLVLGALDLLLESEQGNAALLIDAALPPRTALLECVFVLGCVADRRLDVGRFLPPLPLRTVVDTRLATRNDYAPNPASLARAKEQPIDAARYRPLLAKLVPPMLAACETEARRTAANEIGAALAAAERELGAAQARLTALAAVNPSVRAEEIAALAEELDALRAALATAAPRLDAVRFVCSADIATR